MRKIKQLCPAKINIFLKVIGKRLDGYHELESLMTFIDLFDILEVQESDFFEMTIDGEFGNLVDLKNNILTEIFDYFQKNFRISKNLKIKLTKNIPVGGGLGGGSSNAATFLKILNEIFDLKLEQKKLMEIALKFGSDIPFFLQTNSALIRGRGEIILPYQGFASISALLITPKIAVSTKEVFANFQKKITKESADFPILDQNIFELLNLKNDLETAAVKICPEIFKIITISKNHKAKIAKMSGSGSSCFAIFNNAQDEKNCLEFILKNEPKFFAKPIKILSNVEIAIN